MNQKSLLIVIIVLYNASPINAIYRGPLLAEEAKTRATFNNPDFTSLLGDITNLERVKKQLARGADINQQDLRYGQTPLLLAINNHATNVINYLIDAGADLDLQNNYGYTPLMQTLTMDDYPDKLAVVKKLVRKGANLNLVNHKGQNAFDLARQQREPELIKFLENPEAYTEEENSYLHSNWNKLTYFLKSFLER